MKQTVRIIGGVFRGKKISFPDIEGLRPTPDRVRETVFNWLMHDIKGARCLDAFAGSGALGFEAISRGASSVVVVEQSKAAYDNLKKIGPSMLDKASLQVIKANALDYMQQCNETFDVIFLDPPYALNYLPTCLDWILKRGLLSKEGLVYLEHSNKIELDPQIWHPLKSKQSGHVFYSLFEYVNL